MKKDPKVYLEEIIESIDRIEEYIKGMNYENLEENQAIQDAVMRRLQIIAEAAKRIDESIKTTNSHIPWAKINGLRNAIVHNYDEVDLKAIWDTIMIDLPKTKDDFVKLKDAFNQSFL